MNNNTVFYKPKHGNSNATQGMHPIRRTPRAGHVNVVLYL